MSPTGPSKNAKLIVLTVMLGTVTVSLNNSALNPALPVFMAAFDIGPVLASWLLTGFMISMGITLPVTGYLGAKLGKRRLYLSGLALFVAGSALGGTTTTFPWVIMARCVQGIAGGLLIPLSLAMIFEAYPKHQRGRVTGLWGTVVMLAPAVGPAVGGVLLEFFNWPVLFLMNIPVGLLALLVGYYSLVSPPDEEPSPFDWLGFTLVAAGIGLLLLALSRLSDPGAGSMRWSLALGAIALLCLAAFIRVQLRTRNPLLNLGVFAVPAYRLSVLIVVIQSVSIFGTIVLLPLLLQTVLPYGVFDTAIVLVAAAVTTSLFVNLGGRLLDARGPRGVVCIGLLVSAAPMLAFGWLPATAPLWVIIALMMIRGTGIGLSYMPVTTAGLNAIPEHLVAQGSAMNNILRRITASIAIVLISFYFELRRSSLGANGLSATDSGLAAIQELFVALGLLQLLALVLAALLPDTRSEADTPGLPSEASPPATDNQRYCHERSGRQGNPGPNR